MKETFSAAAKSTSIKLQEVWKKAHKAKKIAQEKTWAILLPAIQRHSLDCLGSTMWRYCSDALRSSINALKVVNDTGERGIALIKKFNDSVRDEHQRQFLLMIVEHHRKVITKWTKAEVVSSKSVMNVMKLFHLSLVWSFVLWDGFENINNNNWKSCFFSLYIKCKVYSVQSVQPLNITQSSSNLSDTLFISIEMRTWAKSTNI